jgi:DNA-directed RNA polymerase subunit RPC12/RpoP
MMVKRSQMRDTRCGTTFADQEKRAANVCLMCVSKIG